MNNTKPKLVVIIGPTSSGKTRLAVELAKKYEVEIVSADSRQVYRGMDVGTGKDLAEYGGVKYHLIDVADPKDFFTLADFKFQADAAIKEVISRGKLPLLVGGSGLYLQAVVDNYAMEANRGVDQGLRQELEQKTEAELFTLLQNKNRNFADKLNNSDRHNKRRLIRYLEIGNHEAIDKSEEQYDSLVLGLNPDKEIVDKKIYKRLTERLEKEDMVSEVAGLERQGVSWQRLRDFGLEYRYVSEYLQEKITYEQMVELLYTAIKQFAKRQMTWFRRWEKQGREIVWIKGAAEAEKKINEFL